MSLHVCILSVSRPALEELVGGLGGSDYALIVCLGVAPADDFQIEVVARNILADGVSGQECVAGQPACLLSTAYLTGNLMKPHFGRLSYNAGDYYCNELYYRCLQHVFGAGAQNFARTGLCPVVFIHVPPLHAVSYEDGLARLKDIMQRIIASNLK